MKLDLNSWTCGYVQACALIARWNGTLKPKDLLKPAGITREKAVAAGCHPDDIDLLEGQFHDAGRRT